MKHVYKYIYIYARLVHIIYTPGTELWPHFLCGWLSILRGQLIRICQFWIGLPWKQINEFTLEFGNGKIPKFQLGRTENLHVSTRLPQNLCWELTATIFRIKHGYKQSISELTDLDWYFRNCVLCFGFQSNHTPTFFLGGWTTHLKKMLVKLDHFLRDRRGKK